MVALATKCCWLRRRAAAAVGKAVLGQERNAGETGFAGTRRVGGERSAFPPRRRENEDRHDLHANPGDCPVNTELRRQSCQFENVPRFAVGLG